MLNIFGTNKLLARLPKVKGKYLHNIQLKQHTWFGVGGPAEIMYLPKDNADLSFFIRNCPHNIPLFVLGGGSNILVRDGGIPGVTIKLDSPAFKQVKIEDNKITCGAGLQNISLKKYLINNSLTGLEFLCSIPGVIGGSLKTNAGCFGKEVKDVIISANIMDNLGNIKQVPVSEFGLSYRNSCFPSSWIILDITFSVRKDTPENIKKILEEQKAYRISSQPYNQKTAGSTFKNPQGLRAWELIKKSECDQLSVGGAKVSEKHCNFLINTGNASAKDIETLGEMIIGQVKQKTFVTLEWEIKRVGIEK
ncbi:MAG: UDP-N-acetylmuramate dehydrogenase [Alphaproteobacteria bacterium]|nr:UDP-N-acetylmuramate dehydrogenase [Alphaproteobacteria bacterium]